MDTFDGYLTYGRGRALVAFRANTTVGGARRVPRDRHDCLISGWDGRNETVKRWRGRSSWFMAVHVIVAHRIASICTDMVDTPVIRLNICRCQSSRLLNFAGDVA